MNYRRIAKYLIYSLIRISNYGGDAEKVTNMKVNTYHPGEQQVSRNGNFARIGNNRAVRTGRGWIIVSQQKDAYGVVQDARVHITLANVSAFNHAVFIGQPAELVSIAGDVIAVFDGDKVNVAIGHDRQVVRTGDVRVSVRVSHVGIVDYDANGRTGYMAYYRANAKRTPAFKIFFENIGGKL